MSAGRDRFDHEEEPGDGMKSLPGEDTDAMRGLTSGKEKEESLPSEFQVRSCSKQSMMSDLFHPEHLQSDESPLSSPSIGSSEPTRSLVPSGEDNMRGGEWQCDYLHCGRVFQKRHDLNRHKKYHLKPFKCSAPACAIRNIGFSLAKDLLRHQKGHGSERYFCPHAGCVSAAGGLFAGFARLDNWRRHLRRHLEGEHS